MNIIDTLRRGAASHPVPDKLERPPPTQAIRGGIRKVPAPPPPPEQHTPEPATALARATRWFWAQTQNAWKGKSWQLSK